MFCHSLIVFCKKKYLNENCMKTKRFNEFFKVEYLTNFKNLKFYPLRKFSILTDFENLKIRKKYIKKILKFKYLRNKILKLKNFTIIIKIYFVPRKNAHDHW